MKEKQMKDIPTTEYFEDLGQVTYFIPLYPYEPGTVKIADLSKVQSPLEGCKIVWEIMDLSK